MIFNLYLFSATQKLKPRNIFENRNLLKAFMTITVIGRPLDGSN